jgi:DNA-binding Xre family transcriptional regulator
MARTAKKKNSIHPEKQAHGIAVGTFAELAEQTMTAASRNRAKKRADAILQRMSLDELRKERKITQKEMAEVMQMAQGEISKFEKRSEVKLGTLRSYVQALGGNLEVRAVFVDRNVELAIGE